MLTMENILGGISNNQSSGEKWLILEMFADILKIYVRCDVDKVLLAVQKRCNEILAADDNSDESQHLVKHYNRYISS